MPSWFRAIQGVNIGEKILCGENTKNPKLRIVPMIKQLYQLSFKINKGSPIFLDFMFQLNFSSLHDSIIIHYTYPAVYDKLTDHAIQKLFYPNLNPRCQVDIFRCQVKATRRQKLKNPGLSNCEFLLFLNFITAAH